MSIGETPGEPGSAALDPGRRLTSLLESFEVWLRAQPPLGSPGPVDGPDLSTLLREFLALRQEINLLTRATRTQQEQNTATLQELSAAVRTLREARSDSNTEGLPPRWKDLFEVRDALARAEREIRKAREGLELVLPDLQGNPEVEEAPLPDLPPVPTVPFWLRWLGVRGPDLTAWHTVVQAIETARAERRKRVEAANLARQTTANRVRQVVASLLEGYGMSLQRLDRLLTAFDLEAIPTEGQRFDPELMEALDGVTGTGRPAGEVIEEVRRGYRQRGRVLRCALVRVAKSS